MLAWISREGRLLRRGHRALARGDAAAAIEAFGAAGAKTWLARALARDGREDEAERIAREAAASDASHVAHLELGILRLDRGEIAGAREAFAEARKREPANPLVRGFAALARWDEDPTSALAEIVATGGILSSRFQARWLMAVERSWQSAAKITLPEAVLAEGDIGGLALRRAKSDLAKLEKHVKAKRARAAVLRLAYLREDAAGVRDPEFRKRVAAAREAAAALLRTEAANAKDDAARRDALFELASAYVDGGDPLPAREPLDAWLAKPDEKDRFSHRIVLLARADVAILARDPATAAKRIAEARALGGPVSPDIAREIDRVDGVAKLALGDARAARLLLERLFARTLYRVEDRVRALWS